MGKEFQREKFFSLFRLSNVLLGSDGAKKKLRINSKSNKLLVGCISSKFNYNSSFHNKEKEPRISISFQLAYVHLLRFDSFEFSSSRRMNFIIKTRFRTKNMYDRAESIPHVWNLEGSQCYFKTSSHV